MPRKACSATLWILVGVTFIGVLTPTRAEDDDQISEALWLADHANLVHKVHTLVIGDVDLKDVTLDQALDFLRRQSRLSDPNHVGINFVPSPQPDIKVIKFSVKLKNATVEDVLNKILSSTMIGYSIGDFTVDLELVNGDSMYSRTFKVPDNVLAINPSMIIDKYKETYDVRPLFKAKGIRFAPGGSAVYAIPAKTLTVVFSDPEQIIRVEELLVYGFKTTK